MSWAMRSRASGQEIAALSVMKFREGAMGELLMGWSKVRAGVGKSRRRQGVRSEPRKVRL